MTNNLTLLHHAYYPYQYVRRHHYQSLQCLKLTFKQDWAARSHGLKHFHYPSLQCLTSWGIAGHSLNLHSLHICNNKTVELTSTVTHTPMFLIYHQSLQCLKTRNKLKTQKWTQNSKMGNLPLWTNFLGEVQNCTPILLFLGPGELPKGGPK